MLSATYSPSDCQFEIVSTEKTLTRRAKYQFQILSYFISSGKGISLRERKLSNLKMTGGHVKEGDVIILKEDGTCGR